MNLVRFPSRYWHVIRDDGRKTLCGRDVPQGTARASGYTDKEYMAEWCKCFSCSDIWHGQRERKAGTP